eukprot:CAMPEP_0195581900 /NCGR_PEP_ID=MMETSP0814-20130614/21182_1 /TAXON_ID=97485 /ORGANISM="Prymnesium parvum, Strain Texoma1" /LENGTH=34 /DNA_ID= /DNA_START= /DNA_END= /DNA_ORIENTATION=
MTMYRAQPNGEDRRRVMGLSQEDESVILRNTGGN